MIKIISGVYGHYVTDKETGKSRVVAKDKNAEPFELTKEQEARLVGLGVAEYVGKPSVDNADDDIARAAAEPSLEEMTAKELREVGKQYGLTFKVGMSKAEMVDALKAEWPQDAEEEADEEADDDGEQAPTFDATEAVQ